MRFEMDANGRHRIVGETCTGEWTIYEDISVLEENGKLYIATPDHFVGIFPPGTVLEVTPVAQQEESRYVGVVA